jgi:hypothetical protein
MGRHSVANTALNVENDMSLAWEVTNEDVGNVLDAHDAYKTYGEIEELLDNDTIDSDAIEKGVLRYTDMDDQTSSMLSDIEDHLMKADVIPKGEKKFSNPE